jgi:hypothetical protein
MNAYIKVNGEDTLTHWEPRRGPQGFLNDTICAVSMAVGTTMFEESVRHGHLAGEPLTSSRQATTHILKGDALKSMCHDYTPYQ